jgi:hypothetical protein
MVIMPTRRLSDAAQAELGILPVAGNTLSFTPTANSGWITSSNANFFPAKAGSNLQFSKVDTARVGVNSTGFSPTLTSFYQTLLEFDVNLPSNAYVTSVLLSIQFTVPVSDGFFIEVSEYNYGVAQASDFIPGDSLLPGKKLGHLYLFANAGFLGAITKTLTFDDIDNFRSIINSKGTYRILLSTDTMKESPQLIFSIQKSTDLSISSATLRFTYVTAGEVIAALIGAFWGIKVTI